MTSEPFDDRVDLDYREQIARAATTQRWGLGDVVGGILIAYLATNIIGVIIVSVAGWESSSQIPMWGFGVLQVPLWSVYLATVFVAGSKGIQGSVGVGVVDSFGLRVRLPDAVVGLVVGVLCQLIVLPILYIPIFWLSGTDSEELSRPAKELASGAQTPAGWILFAVLVGALAPIVEEMFFRGLLLRALSKRGSTVGAAVFFSSAVFAGLHLQVLQFPGLFVFGIVVALMAVATGRLGASIFAHVGFNGTTIVVLYLNHRELLG